MIVKLLWEICMQKLEEMRGTAMYADTPYMKIQAIIA
jgi:hypothetical protein